MSRLISFVVLIASIVVIGFLFYRVMAPFLLPLFLAVLLVVIFYPLHRRIIEYCGDRERVAAAVTTLTVLLIVLLPIMLVVVVAAGRRKCCRQATEFDRVTRQSRTCSRRLRLLKAGEH
jgi:predicted PurR-regulated permease PerM